MEICGSISCCLLPNHFYAYLEIGDRKGHSIYSGAQLQFELGYVVQTWDNTEVARRWWTLCSKRKIQREVNGQRLCPVLLRVPKIYILAWIGLPGFEKNDQIASTGPRRFRRNHSTVSGIAIAR